MEVFEVVNKLEALRGKSSLSASDKSDIQMMYRETLDKEFLKTSCNDCYHDAIIEMYVYLKRNGKMKERSNYSLKNGVLLQMGFGSNEMYTNDNLTDEIAERYLAKNPKGFLLFSVVPTDYQERIEKRMSTQSEYDQDMLMSIIETFKSGVSDKAVMDTYKDYQINGKKVTKKVLLAHVNKALKIIADMEPEESGDDTDSITDKTEE